MCPWLEFQWKKKVPELLHSELSFQFLLIEIQKWSIWCLHFPNKRDCWHPGDLYTNGCQGSREAENRRAGEEIISSKPHTQCKPAYVTLILRKCKIAFQTSTPVKFNGSLTDSPHKTPLNLETKAPLNLEIERLQSVISPTTYDL